MKTVLAAAIAVAISSTAFAQTPDTCAGYLKALADMQAALRQSGATPPPTDPNDAKIIAYCRANPNAPLADAMTKAFE
ncbi:hypothetical protein [Phreatobacter sp.]|uniref:hypothetical protein n=1 Tax=Phreatobacter sp. TaxID=1966341 RepID=UPI0022CB516F|nr:hypothetical protein [Phreatobacter sp.]MCZ8315393.1 hypothetical protein [Phreatobacter sp.]